MILGHYANSIYHCAIHWTSISTYFAIMWTVSLTWIMFTQTGLAVNSVLWSSSYSTLVAKQAIACFLLWYPHPVMFYMHMLPVIPSGEDRRLILHRWAPDLFYVFFWIDIVFGLLHIYQYSGNWAIRRHNYFEDLHTTLNNVHINTYRLHLEFFHIPSV